MLYNESQLVSAIQYFLDHPQEEPGVSDGLIETWKYNNFISYVALFEPKEKCRYIFDNDCQSWDAVVSKVHVYGDSHSYDVDVKLPNGARKRMWNVPPGDLIKLPE